MLPRHPPNALFALDLIQEEQGRWFKANLPSWVSKACILSRATVPVGTGAVSVLDLEQYRLGSAAPQGSTQMTPYSGPPAILMFLSLNDVNSVQLDGKTHKMRFTVKLPASASSSGNGGAYRDRTDDLLNANQALSQLS